MAADDRPSSVRRDGEESDDLATAVYWSPRFCEVLATSYNGIALRRVERLLLQGRSDSLVGPPAAEEPISGLILTSQRAAEAVLSLIPANREEMMRVSSPLARLSRGVEEETEGDCTLWRLIGGRLPVFVVGPATFRLAAGHPLIPKESVMGKETGNGEGLAKFILEYFQKQTRDQISREKVLDKVLNIVGRRKRRRILFPTGDPHRDTIPKALSDPSLPEELQMEVLEENVYRTAEDESFAGRIELLLHELTDSAHRRDGIDAKQEIWIVVFSPQGCTALIAFLRENNLLYPCSAQKQRLTHHPDGTEGAASSPAPEAADTQARTSAGERSKDERGQLASRVGVRVATIGPTTARHLREECKFEPDVVAGRPSPEGLRVGIEEWMERN